MQSVPVFYSTITARKTTGKAKYVEKNLERAYRAEIVLKAAGVLKHVVPLFYLQSNLTLKDLLTSMIKI